MPISSTTSIASTSSVASSTTNSTPQISTSSTEVAGSMAFNTSSDSHTICFC